MIDALKAGAALYFTYINFQWCNTRVWISCCTWMLRPNGLNDTCLCVFVNLYRAYLEEPPANAAANGCSNDCCKWNCRILLVQSEKIKTAAFTGCDTPMCSHPFQPDESFKHEEVKYLTLSFSVQMGFKHYRNYCGSRWSQQRWFLNIWGRRLTYDTQSFTKGELSISVSVAPPGCALC